MASMDFAASTPVPPFASRRKRFRRLRFVLYALSALIFLVALAAAGGALWLRSAAKAALPQLDGEIHLSGAVSAPVTVRRDAHGVPHIEAATQDDLFTAQGYITAQDRLWQMHLYRRHAGGELAEILGVSLLVHDKAQRVLGFRRAAHRIYAGLSANEKSGLEAYARGVNLFIAQHGESLPAEFELLHYSPRQWTGEDSILIGTMMISDLDS